MGKRYRYAHADPAEKAGGGKKWIGLGAAAVVLTAAGLMYALFFSGGSGVPAAAPTVPPPSAVPGAAPGMAEPASMPSSTAPPAAIPTPDPTPGPTPAPTPPPIPDDGSDGYLSEGLYIWKDQAFELFYGGDDSARAYAAAVTSYGEKLAGKNVYDLVVPNHSEFGLPKRIRNEMGCTSQRENTAQVYEALGPSVTAVDIYDALDLHKDESLYFHTDTHWAPLGAYYAYAEFCRVSGVEAAELTSFTKTSTEGFTGYLYAVTGETCLRENPDRIDLYEPGFAYTAFLSTDGSDFQELSGINSPDGSMGYSMFLWGDNPCVRIVNEESHTGRKLAFVKDSYGNAMAPFLAASFDEVHVVDFRSFPQNLAAYCEEQGITDVLFLNNVMSANTYSQIETMNGLFS